MKSIIILSCVALVVSGQVDPAKEAEIGVKVMNAICDGQPSWRNRTVKAFVCATMDGVTSEEERKIQNDCYKKVLGVDMPATAEEDLKLTCAADKRATALLAGKCVVEEMAKAGINLTEYERRIDVSKQSAAITLLLA